MDLGVEMKKIMKEAIIGFLKNIKTDDKEKINNVINFLERGWKYEEMWKELHIELLAYYPPQLYADEVRFKIMKPLEQKYFPQVDKK